MVEYSLLRSNFILSTHAVKLIFAAHELLEAPDVHNLMLFRFPDRVQSSICFLLLLVLVVVAAGYFVFPITPITEICFYHLKRQLNQNSTSKEYSQLKGFVLGTQVIRTGEHSEPFLRGKLGISRT